MDSATLEKFNRLSVEDQNLIAELIDLFDQSNGATAAAETKTVTAGKKRGFPFDAFKGDLFYIADDFDAPLDDFAEYM